MLDGTVNDYDDKGLTNLGHLKGFHAAVKDTVSQRVYDCLEFNQLVRGIKKLDNIKGLDPNNIGRPTQAPFHDFKEDLWNIWDSFPAEEASSIMVKINERRILGQTNDGYDVVLNQNSYEFYRDTNFSISLNSPHFGKESCIVGFKILPGRKIEIFQIQGKGKYGITTEHFGVLLDFTCDFLKSLGFEKVMVIRGDKLFYSRTPIIIPNGVANVEDFIKRNREMITLTYNVNPTRKWGFKKPLNDNDRNWYSAEKILI